MRLALRLAAYVTFGIFAAAWVTAIYYGLHYHDFPWLVDWNVYHSGAIDLADRTLYRVPLVEPGAYLPVERFNYPPLAALEALPLIPLGRLPGGLTWLVISGISVLAAGVAAARSLAVPAAVIGLVLIATVWREIFRIEVGIANDNFLMLAIVAGFVWAHIAGKDRLAGGLLAVAIGTKVWPVAMFIVVLRERRWREIQWALAGLALQAVIFLAWLGPDVIWPMVPAVLGENTPRDNIGTTEVLWTTWARLHWEWWPEWGGYAVAVGLLLIPATGRLGLGLGIMAGLALNTNLWHHYLLTLLLGLGLIAAGVVERIHLQARRKHLRPPINTREVEPSI